MVEATTLIEALELNAARRPERGIHLIDGRGRAGEGRRYPDLLTSFQAAAARLATHGVRRREPMLVALPTSREFIEYWVGGLFHGALPVAMAPVGSAGALAVHLQKLDDVRTRIGAGTVVCSESLRDEARAAGLEELAGACVTAAELDALTPRPDWKAHRAEPDEIAFLQLTSGSTGRQRAVQISHRSALHNARGIDETIGHPLGGPASEVLQSIVSWLPLNHDMGLIGCLFLSLIHGFDLWLMQPKSFLARPLWWLKHLGEHGPTLAEAPNFAFQLCVERVDPEAARDLDLSNWRAAMTGAEMVRPETIDAFCERFGPVGFRPETFRPCYGLAEATLAVTVDGVARGARTLSAPAGTDHGFGLTDIVSVGQPLPDTEVGIFAADGTRVRDGSIGEISVKGPSIFSGYYNDPEASAECLVDGWLRTGDLGFLDSGELYITGRTKDLIIVNGNNLMPHELERIAENASEGGGSRRSAAFSIADGADGERVVLAVEVSETDADRLATIEREVRLGVGHTVSVPLADVVFVRRGRLSKTTSGKVQRNRVRQQYLDGKLERLTVSVPAPTAVEDRDTPQ